MSQRVLPDCYIALSPELTFRYLLAAALAALPFRFISACWDPLAEKIR